MSETHAGAPGVTLQRLPLGVFVGMTAVSLVGMIFVWAWYAITDAKSLIAYFTGLFLLIAVALVLLLQGRAWQMVVNMAPTALLMIIFPIILDTLGQQTYMVLMVAITVPWASSAAVMPVYAPLVEQSRTDKAGLCFAFCRIWPIVTALSLLPLAFFTIVMYALTGNWSLEQIGLYVAGLMSNLIFAHSLVPAQETKRYTFVFAGWVFYAVGLLLLPNLWFVTPLLGVIPQLVLMGSGLKGLFKPMGIELKTALAQTGYGFLTGSVLWADKFFLIALHPQDVDVLMVYVALVPIVAALAVYYTSQYPVLQNSFQRLIKGVNETPLNQLNNDIAAARVSLVRSAVGTVSVATFTGLGILLMSPWFGIHHNILSLLLFVLPPILLFFFLGVMQLTQMQNFRQAALCTGGYASFVAIAFIFSSLLPMDSFVAQAIGLSVTMMAAIGFSVLAILRIRAGVADAPYELFWQKAVAW